MSVPYTKQVAYIESTGTQYIDTGFKPNQDTRVVCSFEQITTRGIAAPFGCESPRYSAYIISSKFRFDYNSTMTSTQIQVENNVQHEIDFNKNNVYLDGTLNTTFTYGNFTAPNLLLFRTTYGGSNFYGRIYWCKVYDNNVLIRDFIPVRVNETGYLYDKVSGELFGNDGSGNFVLGNDYVYYSGFLPFRRRLLYAKPKEVPNYLCFTALESGTFTLTIDANLATSALQYIEYSLDGNAWVKTDNVNSQSVVITTPTIANGGKVYWRGIGNQLANNFSYNPSIFSSTCRFDASGEVMSLLKGKNFTKTRNVGNSAFARLFKDCSTIVNAKGLTIEVGTIGSYGLQEMFINCTSLITTPYINDLNGAMAFNGMFKGCTSLVEVTYDLPIPSTVSNRVYRNMFEGCTALVKTPNLPLTEFGDSAYYSMFRGCTSLVQAPLILPATLLKSSCYARMFYECKSLVNAPSLPATSLTNRCYQDMFYGCTNLVNVPDINVVSFTGTYQCQAMFQQCVSLKNCPIKSLPANVSSGSLSSTFRYCSELLDTPILPAITLNTESYYCLFDGCAKITYIKMFATDISASGALAAWVRGVSATGIFVKNINATWTTTGVSGVPSGWTIIYYDPALDKYYLDQQREIECDKYGNPFYINDGLVFQLDGIDKGDKEGYWTDLIGGYDFQIPSGVSSISDGMVFENPHTAMNHLPQSEKLTTPFASATVEVVCSYQQAQSFPWCSSYNGGTCFCFYNGTIGINMGYTNNPQFKIPSNISEDGTLHTFSITASDCYADMTQLTQQDNTYFSNGIYMNIGSRDAGNWYYGTIKSIRIYSRQLTYAERVVNAKVDNIRFNLGLTI